MATKRPDAPVPTTSVRNPDPNTPANSKTTIDSPQVDRITGNPFGKGSKK